MEEEKKVDESSEEKKEFNHTCEPSWIVEAYFDGAFHYQDNCGVYEDFPPVLILRCDNCGLMAYQFGEDLTI